MWEGQTLTSSGAFIYSTVTEFGCDSVTTMDFTLLDATSSETTETACDSFTWNGNTVREHRRVQLVDGEFGGLRQHGRIGA